MSIDPQQPSGPPSERMHPFVYRALIGLLLWMVAAAWGFTGPHSYSDVILALVTFFAGIFVALPLGLWRLAQHARRGEKAPAGSFREWARGTLQTWQSRLPAGQAAIDILIVPAAAAVGMTALAVVFLLTSSSGT